MCAIKCMVPHVCVITRAKCACAFAGLLVSSIFRAMAGVQPSDQLDCTNTNSKLWSRLSTTGPNKHDEKENG